MTNSRSKIETIKIIFEQFGYEAGAKVNWNKTAAMDNGKCSEFSIMHIPWLHTEERIQFLGITITNSLRLMVHLNWEAIKKCTDPYDTLR